MFTDRILIHTSSILVSLIPIFLLTGPFLPDFCLSVSALIFIYLSIKNRDYQYFQNYFFYLFFLFNLYLILNSFLSSNPLTSFETSLVYFRFGIFSLGIYYLIHNNENFIKIFSYFLIFAFLIALFSGYYQYFTETNIIGQKSYYQNRLILAFDDKMILGGYLSRLLPLLIAMVIYSFKPNIYFYISICLLLIFVDVVVYIAGERTALGLTFISTLLIIVFLSKFRFLRILTFILSIIIFLFITYSNSEIRKRNIDTTISQLGLDDSSDRLNIISPVHESHLFSSYLMFKNQPIVGIGLNQFREQCDKIEYNVDQHSCSTHPHNTYLQFLGELGILGLIFLIAALTYVIYIFLKHILYLISSKNFIINDYQLCLLTCL